MRKAVEEWSKLSKNVQLYLKYKEARPAYAKGQVEEVWNLSKNKKTGKVFDPNNKSKELFWNNPNKSSRWDQWHMGHKPGKEYRQLLQKLREGEIDEAEFLREYKNPANYQAEDPVENMSHAHEEK